MAGKRLIEKWFMYFHNECIFGAQTPRDRAPRNWLVLDFFLNFYFLFYFLPWSSSWFSPFSAVGRVLRGSGGDIIWKEGNKYRVSSPGRTTACCMSRGHRGHHTQCINFLQQKFSHCLLARLFDVFSELNEVNFFFQLLTKQWRCLLCFQERKV